MGLIWTLGRSQTYALLSRMEQAGLVTHKRQAQEKRPDRKNYSLAPGRKKDIQPLGKSSGRTYSEPTLEFLAKIHFLEKGDEKSVQNLIEDQQEVCQDKVFRMEERRRSASSGMERLTYDFRQSQTKAALDWLQGLPSKLRKK